jgi:tripartite-type tricarboxylate transporter receptor subunit TctC
MLTIRTTAATSVKRPTAAKSHTLQCTVGAAARRTAIFCSASLIPADIAAHWHSGGELRSIGGAAPALNDVAAGHVDFMFSDIGTALPLAQGGLLRMLATLTKEAPPAAPDLPTIAAVGMPELLSDTFTTFTAPPGTPLDIREKLAAAMREIIMAPDVKERLNKIGVVPWGLNVQESAAHIAAESERWSAIVKRANLRPE